MWFLQPDPKTGQIRDPFCMDRMGDMTARYGRVSDYEQHLRLVQSAWERSPDLPGLRAVWAAMLWGSESGQARARFAAQQLTEAQALPSGWGRLRQLMDIADQEQPGAYVSPGLTGFSTPIQPGSPH
jgi:hypothetical protein